MRYLTTLKLNKEFRRVYYKAKYKAHPLIVTYAMKNRRSPGRYGVTASKKAGNAVKRNRARRIITAALRELEQTFDLRGFDLVLVARAETSGSTSTKLTKIIRKHLQQLTADNQS